MKPGTPSTARTRYRWNSLLFVVVIAVSAWGYWLRFGRAGQTDTELAALAERTDFASRLAAAALERTKERVRYDPAYVVIEYPGGDVPAHTGVCTDVVVRSYRALGIDLQQRVHEDMKSAFSRYPALWGLSRPDPNIDHRRVPNLQTYLTRNGESLPISKQKSEYLPGDLVAWDLNHRGLWHIGVVVGKDRFVHNIGAGPVLEEGLFEWKVIGHYRYHPEKDATPVAKPVPVEP